MATNRYGQTVAIIYADKTLLNEELVKAGLAWVYDFYCSEPICESWENFQLGPDLTNGACGPMITA